MFELEKSVIDSGLTAIDLRSHPDIEDNLTFYLQYWSCPHKPYHEMTKEQKELFGQTVRDHYYDWLHLSDEILKQNPSLCTSIATWFITHHKAGFIAEISNSIVNAHRNALDRTKVDLDPAIRARNKKYVDKVSAEPDTLSEDIMRVARLLDPRLAPEL